MSKTSTWFASRAWLGRPARDVVIDVEAGRVTQVREGADRPADASPLPGLVIPGLANAHSHAFHRALRARTEGGTGDFWRWREMMYEVAGRLDPDRYHALARATYAEMALAGVTAVGEFHYVHHRPDGGAYDDPNAMRAALVSAAAEAGIRLTLIDTCYLRGGVDDEPLTGAQRRFSDGDVESWASRAAHAPAGDHVRLAAGIHSVRAVDAPSMGTVAAWAAERDVPVHAHVSEQPAENEAAVTATGRTPTGLLRDHGVLGTRTTAVHATHLTEEDVAVLGGSGTAICLCPTTERALGDGVGPAAALRRAGSPLCMGSDSHAVIDLFEEARAVELDERLITGRRGHHTPEQLLADVTAGGMSALGWDAGSIAVGQRADLVAVDTGSPRLAGTPGSAPAAAVVHSASATDVTHVVADGRVVVADGEHVGVDVGRELDLAIRAVFAGVDG